jgi:hypothetical protein
LPRPAVGILQRSAGRVNGRGGGTRWAHVRLDSGAGGAVR